MNLFFMVCMQVSTTFEKLICSKPGHEILHNFVLSGIYLLETESEYPALACGMPQSSMAHFKKPTETGERL